ncbi:hypothetical protein D9619_003552 [Psilocybe cf. subviscida]|uniref:F-box domain-containing protein n=1 Tax=Psilocybe cf. subviscida TaxID=2480587 RepID=A0A8H5EUJ3_9AGAR|nr:hypothetical protein D9619_003552 [Psilocybe cf. subviscida]
MASKVASFFKGLLGGLVPDSETTPTDLDKRPTADDSEIVQRNIYGDALYYELEYRRHVKQMQDFELQRDRHFRRLQDSAYERNMHRRIMKLPAEILSLIFHCMRQPPPTANPAVFETFPFKQRTEEWVFVTWVCRHWRNVALNDPTLWTIVPYLRSRWIPEIIERSRNAGLKIDLTAAQKSDKYFSLVLKHSHRISQLKLRDLLLGYIFGNFDLSSTPKLERLSVGRSVAHYPGGPLKNIYLPTNVFTDCENLRYLELCGIHVILAPNFLPSIIRSSLRHLRLSHCTFPRIQDFKPAMRRIECLESLLLHNTLSRHLIPASYAPMTLASLTSLDLDEFPTELIWFFNNFVLTPRLKHTRIVTRLSPEPNGDLVKLLALMSHPGALGYSISTAHSLAFEMDNSIWTAGNIPIPALVLKGQYAPKNTPSVRFSVDDYRDITIFFAQRPPSHFPLSLRHQTFHGMFSHIFQHFEWTNLRELRLVKFDCNFSSATFGQTLRATFGRLRDIRVVRVGAICARPLIDALWLEARQRQRNVKDEPRKELSFAGLQEIYVEGVSFDYGHETSYTDDSKKVVEATRFVNCLQWRLERGLPIQKLGFTSCTALTSDHLRAFMGVVPDVSWDGEWPESSSDDEEDDSDSDEVDTSEEEDSSGEEDSSEDMDSSEDDDNTEDDDNSEDDESSEEHSSGDQSTDVHGSSDEESTDTESDFSTEPEYLQAFFVHPPTDSQAS